MAHYQQLRFINELNIGLPDYFSGKKVLEVGSWDVNGSVRSLFKECEYLGVDVAEGPGVDLVCKGESIQLPDCTFDVVISCECFEHNQAWEETFRNMIRMLRPGGLCVVTCASLARLEHGTKRTTKNDSLTSLNNFPNYYRNLKKSDFKRSFDLSNIFDEHYFYLNPYARDLYFVGIKKGDILNFKPLINKGIIRRIRSFTTMEPTSSLNRLKLRAKFYFLYSISMILGESKYHNLRFTLRSSHNR